MKRHHDHSKSYKRKHLIGACLEFLKFSPLSSWLGAWWQADKVLKKQLRALRLDLQAIGRGLRYWVWSEHVWALKAYFHSDVLLPARLRHLNLPKQCHQMGTKHSTAWDYKEHLIQTDARQTYRGGDYFNLPKGWVLYHFSYYYDKISDKQLKVE